MATVEKMTIALTPEMAGFVRGVVEAGEYASTSEAIREAVREWKERREPLRYTVDELRALVQEGIDSGPTVDGAEAFSRIRARLRTLSSRKG